MYFHPVQAPGGFMQDNLGVGQETEEDNNIVGRKLRQRRFFARFLPLVHYEHEFSSK